MDYFELNCKNNNQSLDVLKNTDIDRNPLQTLESSHTLPHEDDSRIVHFLYIDCSQNNGPPLETEKVTVTVVFN